MRLEILLAGFPGKSDRGTLGWCTVAALKTSAGVTMLDTGSYGDRALLLTALENKGIDRLKVNRLFISHLHYDHCLNADLFPNAELIIGIHEWEYANSQLPEKKGDTFVPKCFLPYLVSRQIQFVGEGQYLQDGLRVIELPGHTPGCIGLLLEQQNLLFAADAVKNARDFNFRDPGMSFDSRNNGIASMEKAAQLATNILPGHDSMFSIHNGIITRKDNPKVIVTSFSDWQVECGKFDNLPGSDYNG